MSHSLANQRSARHWCMCFIRRDPLGPCFTWLRGSDQLCVHCKHEAYCHQMLNAAMGKPFIDVRAKNDKGETNVTV